MFIFLSRLLEVIRFFLVARVILTYDPWPGLVNLIFLENFTLVWKHPQLNWMSRASRCTFHPTDIANVQQTNVLWFSHLLLLSFMPDVSITRVNAVRTVQTSFLWIMLLGLSFLHILRRWISFFFFNPSDWHMASIHTGERSEFERLMLSLTGVFLTSAVDTDSGRVDFIAGSLWSRSKRKIKCLPHLVMWPHARLLSADLSTELSLEPFLCEGGNT